MKNKLIMLVGLLSLMLVIVGCGTEDDSKVQSEEITQDVETTSGANSYYNDVTIFVGAYMDFMNSTMEAINNADINESNKQQIIDDTNEFILFSQAFNTTPITNEDKIFHKHFEDLIFDTERQAEYTLQYAYKGNDSYRSFTQDSFKNAKIHLDLLAELEKQYYQ